MGHNRLALGAVILGILVVLAIFAAILLWEGDDAGPGGSENQSPSPKSQASLVTSTETSMAVVPAPE